MSSPRVGNPRVGVSASCPVTMYTVAQKMHHWLQQVQKGTALVSLQLQQMLTDFTHSTSVSILADICRHFHTHISTSISCPLSTCVYRRHQLRSGGFCWSKVSSPVCPCWRQMVDSNYKEDARLLLNDITYTCLYTMYVGIFIPE